MPIPLLRLPLLVLDEVIKNVGIRQSFFLSLCSKRMNWVVKNLREKSIKLTMSLVVCIDIEIFVKAENKLDPVFAVTIQAMTNSHLRGWRAEKLKGILCDEYYSALEVYLVDVNAGTRPLLEYMSDLFCAPIKEVSIYENRFFWILDMIENMQGPGSYQAFINDDVPKDEQFRRLLVDWKPSTLRVKNRYEEFRIRNSPENLKEITWFRGNWMTIENLLTIDCNRLSVHEPTFTVTEMNRFFRHVLIDDGVLRLTHFAARLQNNRENERILKGVRELLTPIDGKEQFEDNGRSWEFSGILKRGDRSATVSIKCLRIEQPIFCLEIVGA